MKRLLAGLGVVCLLAGLGPAGWISAKAWLANGLIESAWQAHLLDGQAHPPWPWADTYPVARLKVPDQGVDQVVLAGMSGRSIAFAPGMAMAGSRPGQPGTILISGHRDTHLAFLARVQVGEVVELQDQQGRWHRFVVSDRQVVPADARISLSSTETTLLLATCYPFAGISGNASQRVIFTALPV